MRLLFPKLLFPAILLLFSFPSESVAKSKWYTAEFEGLQIYSNASKGSTKRTIEDILDARKALNQLFPRLITNSKIPLRLVICKDLKTAMEFGPLYDGKPKKLGGYFVTDFEGPLIMICLSGGSDYTKELVYHEYIHYITKSPNYHLPTWLNEGLAELFSTIETSSKGKISIGDALPSRIYTLRNKKTIPLERLFQINRASPEYNSNDHGQGVFYAQSWLLLHYIHFGRNELPENSLNRLVNHAISGQPFNEETIQKLLGVDFDTLTKSLSKYSRIGRFSKYTYTLENPIGEEAIELREAADAEINLIQGILLLRNRGPKEAYSKLVRAEQALPDSPIAAAYRAYHFLQQDQLDWALEYFEKAVTNGSQSAYTYLNYANLLNNLSNSEGKIRERSLNKEDTIKILSQYFRARELAGAFSPELYFGIGKTWMSSKITPSDKHMQVIVEGLGAFPEDDRIAFTLALYQHQSNRNESALQIADRYLSNDLSGAGLANFTRLRQEILKSIEGQEKSE